MRSIRAFVGSAALWALLAARVAVAVEPVTVAAVVGAMSLVTSYLSYSGAFCRFSECCHEKRTLNAWGTCPRAGRGGRDSAGRSVPPPARRAAEHRLASPSQAFLAVTARRTGRSGAGRAPRHWGSGVHLHPESPPAFGSCLPSPPPPEPTGVAGKLARSSAAKCLFG